MKKIISSLFVFSLCIGWGLTTSALTPSFAQSKTIVIAADNWCPINCAKPEMRLGVGIDLAKAVFEPLGYKIDYQLMTWSEALEKVRTGQVDAVIGASKYDDATLVFPRQPVYHITDDFYVLKGNSWRFQGAHTLKAKRLGVIEDYGYGPNVSDYIKNNKDRRDAIHVASGEFALRDNIKKLQRQEIDVLVETKPVMEYTMLKMRLSGKFQHVGSLPQAPVFLAFSPAASHSKSLAAAFDAGIQKLASSGKLEDFYTPYGLSARDRGK